MPHTKRNLLGGSDARVLDERRDQEALRASSSSISITDDRVVKAALRRAFDPALTALARRPRQGQLGAPTFWCCPSAPNAEPQLNRVALRATRS